jgi:hypothetical protein
MFETWYKIAALTLAILSLAACQPSSLVSDDAGSQSVTGPAGPPGPAGPTGPTGPTGPAGSGANGSTGSGSSGGASGGSSGTIGSSGGFCNPPGSSCDLSEGDGYANGCCDTCAPTGVCCVGKQLPCVQNSDCCAGLCEEGGCECLLPGAPCPTDMNDPSEPPFAPGTIFNLACCTYQCSLDGGICVDES